MKNKLKIAIIIPAYSDFIEQTVEAAGSVLKNDYDNKLIIVVDDGSEKKIQSRLSESLSALSPKVLLELSNMNRGFGAACNTGAKIAIKQGADLLFFLNNDAIIKEDCLFQMAEEFKEPGVGIVGPKIYLGKTRILNSVGGYFDKKTLLKREYGCGIEDTGQFDKRREVEFVMGSAFMVTVSIFQTLKGFDESFFMYSEETDFCYRAVREGYKIVYQPKAIVWHKHAGTIGDSKNRVMYYQMRNGIYLSRKNGRFSNVFFTIIHFHYTHLKSIFKGFIKSLFVFVMALFDGLRGRMGKKKSRFFS